VISFAADRFFLINDQSNPLLARGLFTEVIHEPTKVYTHFGLGVPCPSPLDARANQ